MGTNQKFASFLACAAVVCKAALAAPLPLDQLAGPVMAATTDVPTKPGQVRPIGIIDFYGLRLLTAERLRSELTFKVGDSVTIGDHSYTFFDMSKRRLMKVPGVVNAHVDVVCCTDDLPVVFVGINERNAPILHFTSAPTGSIRLPPDLRRIGEEYEKVLDEALLSGQANEDDSEGHTLLLYAAARPTEDRMIDIANRDLPLLRKTLRSSADYEHRALAAQLLGYSKDQQSVVPDLIFAMRDPSTDVRNNAMRALWVFTMATKVEPPRVPFEPFVTLLNSPFWLDRNKSSLALMQLASTRNPTLLAMLRERALVSLVEMARWTDRSHAAPAFFILGSIAGLDDKVVSDAWDKNDRDRVIQAALRVKRN